MTDRLPKGWMELPLGEAVEVCDHLRMPVNAKERSKRAGSYPYYGATGQVGWIDDFRQDGEYVLLGEDGAPFLELTKPKAYLVRGKCWVNNHAHVLRGKDGVLLNRYLLHMLNDVDYRTHVNGTTRLKLTQNSMRQIPLRIAPIPQQERIVARIEELFSALDAGVAALQRARTNLKRYRAALLKASVEGKLTEEWRKSHPVHNPKSQIRNPQSTIRNPQSIEPASELLKRILAERRRRWEQAQLEAYEAKGKKPPQGWKDRYREPVGPPSSLPASALPNGWCWATVEQLAEVITGSTPSKSKSEYFGGPIPFMKPTDLNVGYYVRESDDSLTEAGAEHARMLPAETVLVTCIGATIGKTGLARVPCATNQQINAVVQYGGDSLSRWLYWVFSSPFGQKQIRTNASATTLPILNKGRFAALPIPIPPEPEIGEILAQVEDCISISEKTEEELQLNQRREARLRQAILTSAFNGIL